MPDGKVSYVSEVLDGKVSRSDTCEIVLKQKWGNETPYPSPIRLAFIENIH